MIGLGVLYFKNEGAFVSWKSISAPVRFERIIQATSANIWVQTVDDSIYEGNIYCRENKDCQAWQVVEQVPVDFPTPEYPIKRASGCQFNEFSFLKRVPGEATECVRSNFGFADSSTVVYYALLDDGTILFWKCSSSNIEDFVIVFCSAIVSILICLIGFVTWYLKDPERAKAG
jgi:hypothetical protein